MSARRRCLSSSSTTIPSWTAYSILTEIPARAYATPQAQLISNLFPPPPPLANPSLSTVSDGVIKPGLGLLS